MKNLSIFRISFFFGLVFFMACAKTTPSNFHGKWVLTSALRGGKSASSMQGIFFDFRQDGTLATNFSAAGDTLNGKWSLDKKQLVVETNDPVNFEVVEMTDSTFRAKTEWHNFDFDIVASRAD